MLLKSLQLQGYKTFAGKTDFEFAGSITCIVGPNGSGKSNIADSIRWVLGEQSYRLLRGKKTDDMIFAGSEFRPRASMASTTIIFDNSNGWLPIDFSEVSITRRAYRDSNNEYLLNGQRVRLRDIAELLGNSGLAERTYTIIGQGLVDATLALKADERRALFEEAAGIGLYRARRDEAQKRLENTFRNLERVEDILSELKPRLRSLERQARRAEQYEQVKADLRMLLRDYYGYHWYRAQQEFDQARENARIQESLLGAVRQEQINLDQKLTNYRDSIQGLRARLSSWHREMSSLHTQREKITRDLAVSDEQIRSLTLQQQNANDEIARLSAQVESYQGRVEDTEQEIARLKSDLIEARNQLQKAQEDLQTLHDERSQVESIIHQAQQELNTFIDKQTRIQTRLSEREESLNRQRELLDQHKQDLNHSKDVLSKAEIRVKKAQQAFETIQEMRQKTETELIDHRKILNDIEAERKKAFDALSEQQTASARIQAQLEVLEQADAALIGYASGTQLVLKSAQNGRLQGALNAISALLDVPEDLELAFSAALGEYLDAVMFDKPSTIDAAIEVLLDEDTRGALLPLQNLVPMDPISVPKLDGVIGLAADMLKVPAEFRPAVDLLLGQTLIVNGRDTARKALAGQPLQARAVTLRGEVFYASGPVFTGAKGASNTLSRSRLRREYKEQSDLLNRRVKELDHQVQNLDRQINGMMDKESELVESATNAQRQERAANEALTQIRMETERANRQAEWQREQYERLSDEIQLGEVEIQELSETLTRLAAEISSVEQNISKRKSSLAALTLEDYQQQMSYWTTQAAVAERALRDVQVRLKEHQSAYQDVVETLQMMRERKISFNERLGEIEKKIQALHDDESSLASDIEKLQALIEPAQEELGKVEKARDDMRLSEGKARQALSLAERRNSEAQVALNRKQERLDTMRERIEDDFGLVEFEYSESVSGPKPLPLGELVEHLQMVSELPEGLDEIIKRQRGQLRRMGAVNSEAQTEYHEVRERFEFMTNQVADLHQAEKDIKEVITELDILMEREFRRTFEAVAAEFRQIFTRLFGGGTARLILTDPSDLTDTGIDIEARLPGRRTQGLSLLSGGERSLTATALVFSLLKVSPTPFCVLDEVDAMLDEANVGRFRDLLRELSQNTQFIVITHNRNTVQAADVIYGVTMGRDSASQVVSLKLDEVGAVVD